MVTTEVKYYVGGYYKIDKSPETAFDGGVYWFDVNHKFDSKKEAMDYIKETRKRRKTQNPKFTLHAEIHKNYGEL